MAIGYDAAGRHASTTYDDGSTVRIQRDATGRIVERTTDPAGAAPPVSTRYLYAGDGDVPFAQTSGGTLTREIALPGEAQVSLTATAATWQYPSMLGHTLTTGDGTTTADGVQLWDPYGQPLDAATYAIGTTVAEDTGQVAGHTGWHQAALKPAETVGSTTMLEMGARLYVPALGRFLQVDPVEGGVDNDYVWRTDSIDKSDLTDEADWEAAWNIADIALTVACFVPVLNVVAAPIRFISLAVRLTRGLSTVQRLRTAREAVGVIQQARRWRRGAPLANPISARHPTITASRRAAHIAAGTLVARSRLTRTSNGRGALLNNSQGWMRNYSGRAGAGRMVLGYRGGSPYGPHGLNVRMYS